jgi:hypothetical protein
MGKELFFFIESHWCKSYLKTGYNTKITIYTHSYPKNGRK